VLVFAGLVACVFAGEHRGAGFNAGDELDVFEAVTSCDPRPGLRDAEPGAVSGASEVPAVWSRQ